MDAEVSVDELAALLADDDVHVVDIRSPGAFRQGHIPGSENVPFGDLPDRVEELDGEDRVVTVCPHGKASVQAARLVASYEGFEGRVESLAEGIDGWQEAGHELETDDEEQTTEDVDAPF